MAITRAMPASPGTRCGTHFETVEPDLTLIIHGSRVHGPRCKGIRGNHVSTALFRDANEAFLPGITVNVRERGLMILEGAHLLELLLDTPAPFKGQLYQFGQLFLRHLAVRIEQLDQPGDGLADRFHIAGIEMRTESKGVVNKLGVVVLTQLTERLSQVVHYEAIMIREEFDPHLGDLPSREVKMQAVEERHILADHFGHR